MFPQSDHADEFSNKNGVHLHQFYPPPRSQGKKKKLQKGAGHLSFQKMKAVKVSFDISPRDTYLAMFIKPDIF